MGTSVPEGPLELGLPVLETFAGRLIKVGVLARRDIPSLTKYQIILARDQYRKNPSSQNMGMHQGIIEGDFALCISLYHGYELLLQMGVRSLFIYLCGIMDGSKGLSRTKTELGRNEDFMKLYQQLRDMFSGTSLASANGNVYKSTTVFENKKEFIYSHPKLRKLEEIVIEHFKSWKGGSSGSRSADAVDTRVMIFSSFRDSVQEIADMLSRLRPVVRVMTFVGHSTGKSTKGFTQKEQLEVVKRFREGGYNTLVSTCVGEEGLDIGEVDLIICFDAQKSPIRLVQRMGRTGRRRQGRIVVILAEGREERTYNQSQSNKRSIHKALSGNKMLHFYQRSPRMIPEGINPKLHKMFITAEKYEPSDSRALSKERRSSSLWHKSALFPCQKQTHRHENWSLSPEEFEIWDRLYRIKESDGVKEPVLPQIRFETLENLEETPKHEEKATRELSLSEWSLWQNRPFPTSVVGHSDRCYHFISVMEMIELMRHEQGDCSYELEIQPHLRIEDVSVQRNKSHPSTTSSTLDQKAARRLALVESADQGNQKDEELEVTFDLNESIDLWDNSESTVIRESAAIKEYQTADKACKSLGTNHTDSGYSSFTAEKSPVSSDLFYLPESHVDSFALVRLSEEPSWLKQAFSDVKRLLSQSPPSLNRLYDLENMMRNEETRCPFQTVISESYSARLRDKVCPASSEVNRSVLLFENPELKATSESCAAVRDCSSKTVLSSETAVVKAEKELPWNDSFDSLFDDEEFTEIQKKTPTINHALTNNPSNKYFLQKDKDHLEINKNPVITDEEKSTHLFEDDHVPDANNRSLPRSSKHFARPEAGGSVTGPVVERGSGRFPSEARCRNADEAQEEQPLSSRTTTAEVSGGAGAMEQLLDSGDLYDSSQELFSVNFDLGFSIEECENESFEENINPNNTGKLNGASGSHADVKSTEGRTENLEDTNVRGSRVSPGEGTSCESEEEIVFQRKNRKKKNVLKSPDGMDDSDLESPVRAVRKRRHLLTVSDTSSDDSTDFRQNSTRATDSSAAACAESQRRRTKRQRVRSSLMDKELTVYSDGFNLERPQAAVAPRSQRFALSCNLSPPRERVQERPRGQTRGFV
ncbi:PREDICTED: Fanconi anemia group M protein-like, partial [Leptosomus discolor]|uniref:Fanconi anemia group M protein-like n=1 Tax=Leptosomus discolor TaxID=188344 RepID=UPI0005223B22